MLYVFASFSDVHNNEVKEMLKREITGSFRSDYSDSQIRCELGSVFEPS